MNLIHKHKNPIANAEEFGYPRNEHAVVRLQFIALRIGPARWLALGATAKVALLLCALALLSAGCAHESALTTVHANGSWTRKTVYTMSESDATMGMKSAKQLALQDIFTPPAGPGWKVVRTKTGDKPPQIVVTAIKEAGPAETISGDLTVKNAPAKGQPAIRVVNSASVQPAGPGRWRYTETFHWVGAKPKIEKDMSPLLGRSVKKSLPKALATDANVRALSLNLERTLWRTLFSPPEPLLLDFYDNLVPITGLSDPNERESTLTRRLGPGIEAALLETFGARMSPDLRHQCAVRLVRQITSDTGAQAGKSDTMGGSAGSSPSTDKATESFGGMYPVAITVVVKMPGRVIETNGLVDDLLGEVYWTLYPQAALGRDITLRVVFEARGSQAANNLPSTLHLTRSGMAK